MRMFMGFIRPSAGSCTVLGRSFADDARLRLRVGYLPGDFRADPTMTARELFGWFARLRCSRGSIAPSSRPTGPSIAL